MSNDDPTDGVLPNEENDFSAATGGDGDRAGGEGDGAAPPGDDDATGYGKPPKAHRFKPGKSGNPKGRPRGAPGLRTILEKEFGHRLPVSQGGRKLKLSKLQYIVKIELEKAMEGNQRAIEHVLALNLQMFGLGKDGPKEEEELTLGEQLYLDAIMKRAGPLSDDEAGREADPDFHNQVDEEEGDYGEA